MSLVQLITAQLYKGKGKSQMPRYLWPCLLERLQESQRVARLESETSESDGIPRHRLDMDTLPCGADETIEPSLTPRWPLQRLGHSSWHLIEAR